MKVIHIVISLDGNPIDVIEYIDGKYNSPKAQALVLKWIQQEICDLKAWEQISHKRMKVISTKDKTYDITFHKVGFMKESDLNN
jgi:hypothetical protein